MVGQVKWTDKCLIVEKILHKNVFPLVAWHTWFGVAMLKSEALSFAPHSFHMREKKKLWLPAVSSWT